MLCIVFFADTNHNLYVLSNAIINFVYGGVGGVIGKPCCAVNNPFVKPRIF